MKKVNFLGLDVRVETTVVALAEPDGEVAARVANVLVWDGGDLCPPSVGDSRSKSLHSSLNPVSP